MGQLNFILNILENNTIRTLYNKKWYPEALYLLAMTDYISKLNSIPLCTNYNDIRAKKLEKVIYPSGVLIRAEAVSYTHLDQPHGIVLVFSAYENGAAADWGFSTFFVPKEYVNKHSGKGMDFPMGTATFGVMANKYLYVGNSTIRGNDTNKQSGTGTSGIKYENGYYVLRYVLGV